MIIIMIIIIIITTSFIFCYMAAWAGENPIYSYL